LVAKPDNSSTELFLPSLREFALPIRGRPQDREVQHLGQVAAALHERQKLSFGQIARKLCRQKIEKDHKCDKRCVDRIRQAAKPYRKAHR
jgi:hypothetical protein